MEALLEAHAPESFLSKVEALHQGEVAILQGGVGVKRLALEDGRDAFKVGRASSYGTGNVRFEDYTSDTYRTPPDAVRSAFRKSAQSDDPDSLGGTTRLMSFSGVQHDGAEVRVRDFTTDGKVIIATPGTGPATEKVVKASSLVKPTPVGWMREDAPYPYNEPDPEVRAKKVAHLNRSVKIGEAETGKPGTNWKQVTPENRKKVDPLVKHWMGHAKPFTACFNELSPEKGAEAARKICAVVKDMGMKTTKWRTGGKKAAVQAALVTEFTGRLLEAADGDVEIVQRYLLFEIVEAQKTGSGNLQEAVDESPFLSEAGWSDPSRAAALAARKAAHPDWNWKTDQLVAISGVGIGRYDGVAPNGKHRVRRMVAAPRGGSREMTTLHSAGELKPYEGGASGNDRPLQAQVPKPRGGAPSMGHDASSPKPDKPEKLHPDAGKKKPLPKRINSPAMTRLKERAFDAAWLPPLEG